VVLGLTTRSCPVVLALVPLVALLRRARARGDGNGAQLRFFMYYFTLVVTRWASFAECSSGGAAAARFSDRGIPTAHPCGGYRPAVAARRNPNHTVLHVLVLLAYAAAGFYAASVSSAGAAEITMLWIKALQSFRRHCLPACSTCAPVRLSRLDRGRSRQERFKLMERKLYWGIMAPGPVDPGFGAWL